MPAPPPPLPAGLYWIPYVTCDDCAAPAALVAYVTPNEAQARRIKGALDGTLPLGWPWVIHTDELDDRGTRVVVPGPGIAIVVGTYTSVDDAKRTADRAAPYDGVRARVIDLAGAERADLHGENASLVTVVDRGAPVAAWSARDVAAVLAVADASESDDALPRELAKLAPACTVQAGELFLAHYDDLRWYRFAPVRCGDELAYIPWTSSLLGHAAVVDGRLRQIVGAECDSPDIQEWRYDEHGRHSEPVRPPQFASAGC